MTVRALNKPRAAPGHSWRVGKTMQADARGAIKLSRKFGNTLICVRYRLSPDRKQRLTTVELEVERVAVRKKANPLVAVKIYESERNLIAAATAKGAWFNADTRLWWMNQNAAHALRLGNRIARARGYK